MDTSSQCNAAWLLHRSLTNVSGFGARGLHRADRQWESCRLVGLLRQTHLPTRSLGFIFHGMGRTLNGAVPAAGAAWREPSAGKVGNPSHRDIAPRLQRTIAQTHGLDRAADVLERAFQLVDESGVALWMKPPGH